MLRCVLVNCEVSEERKTFAASICVYIYPYIYIQV